MADQLVTDSELQVFEDRIAGLPKGRDVQEWKKSQEGIAYALEERVSGEQRLMIVMIAKLAQVLLQQLKLEIQGAPV